MKLCLTALPWRLANVEASVCLSSPGLHQLSRILRCSTQGTLIFCSSSSSSHTSRPRLPLTFIGVPTTMSLCATANSPTPSPPRPTTRTSPAGGGLRDTTQIWSLRAKYEHPVTMFSAGEGGISSKEILSWNHILGAKWCILEEIFVMKAFAADVKC